MKKCLVYTLRVANELVKRGYKIIDTGINIQKPQYTVFYFEDTEALRAEIADITAHK